MTALYSPERPALLVLLLSYIMRQAIPTTP